MKIFAAMMFAKIFCYNHIFIIAPVDPNGQFSDYFVHQQNKPFQTAFLSCSSMQTSAPHRWQL